MDSDGSEELVADQGMDGQDLSIEIFYNVAADTTVRLKDGKILKFNKAAFCTNAKSRILYQIFYGPLKVNMTKIDDIDYDTFKLFLDCVMGYDEYNFMNALKIFPVVHKYQIDHLMRKCLEYLVPTEMNEKVCDVLNLAVFYSCDKLIRKLNRFLASHNVYKFLENEDYCHLLEPDALKMIMKNLTIDSDLLMILMKWGKNYITKNCLSFASVRDFFEKYDLLQFFKLEYFDATKTISEFCLLEGKNIFSFEEVLKHVSNSKNLIHGKSKWLNIEKGSILKEQIVTTGMAKNNIMLEKINVKIERHKAIFPSLKVMVGEKRKGGDEKEKNKQILSCKIKVMATHENGHQIIEYSTDKVQFSCLDLYQIATGEIITFYSSESWSIPKCTFHITWEFLQSCRILLTTRVEDGLNKPDELYFTKNISPWF